MTGKPRDPLPPRPWGKRGDQAPPTGPWWCVRRLKSDGSVGHNGSLFRHPTIEEARREAGFLAEHIPGVAFVVLHAVEVVRVPIVKEEPSP